MELLFKALKHFSFSKGIAQWLFFLLIKKTFLRNKVNIFYNQLNFKEKKQFHALFSDMFQNRAGIDGEWFVDFLNARLRFNLSRENSWLEWNTALSILGHDIEIKETYEYLIKNENIQYFFDIGANYGTHSLLFLSQNIQTISFEPNPNCHDYFKELLADNNLIGDLETFAVGEKESIAQLMFPDRKTWLGRIQTNENPTENIEFKQNIIDVHIKSLDSYLADKNLKPDLIKIDTEGFEKHVLAGATYTLAKYHPLIIFECDPQERGSIFDILEGISYNIVPLPFTKAHTKIMDKKTFFECRLNNFMATHKDFRCLQ